MDNEKLELIDDQEKTITPPEDQEDKTDDQEDKTEDQEDNDKDSE